MGLLRNYLLEAEEEKSETKSGDKEHWIKRGWKWPGSKAAQFTNWLGRHMKEHPGWTTAGMAVPTALLVGGLAMRRYKKKKQAEQEAALAGEE